MRRVLAIDPSIKALGWAVMEDGNLIDSGYHLPSAKGEWLDRTVSTNDWVLELLADCEADSMVIEWPYLAAGDGKSGAAANAMSATKLFVLVGMLYRTSTVPAYLAPVAVWKGQVAKTLTASRVKRRYGWGGTDLNESDAIGIGDWFIRKSGKWES